MGLAGRVSAGKASILSPEPQRGGTQMLQSEFRELIQGCIAIVRLSLKLGYELLFTASLPDLANTISDTSKIAPITMALSATLKAGQ